MPYPYDDETGRGQEFDRPWLGWVLLSAIFAAGFILGRVM